MPRSIEIFLNGRSSISSIIINGWVQETTPFESIKEYTLEERIYEDRAMNVYAQLEIKKYYKSSSLTDNFFRSHFSESNKVPLIDLLLRGLVAVDRNFIMQLCAPASQSATKEAVLVVLNSEDNDLQERSDAVPIGGSLRKQTEQTCHKKSKEGLVQTKDCPSLNKRSLHKRMILVV
jgi:hypothetical protein